MAFIQNDEDDELQQGQGGQGPQVGQGSNLVDGAGTGGAAGQGAGAGQGWTNIQAYLNANKGDTGSSQALTNTVKGQFDQEREKMTGESSKFLNDAKTQNQNSIIGTGQADQYINQAGDLYKYDNKNTTGGKTTYGPGEGTNEKVTPGQEYQAPTYDNGMDYGGVVNKMQSFLNGTYQGPKEYNYGFDAKTQNYGSGLKDNAGFDTLMNSVYSSAAQKPLTAGQFQLQKQFDVNNEALGQSRKNLAGSYDQLVGDRDSIAADTTSQLSGLENEYRTSQTGLKNHLGRRSNSYQTKIDQAEADARAGFNAAKGETSGYGNAFANVGFDPLQEMGVGSGGQQSTLDELKDFGLSGDKMGYLTWDQLQKEQDYGNAGTGANTYQYLKKSGRTDDVSDIRNNFSANSGYLNDFYGAQDAKYANTADAEERRYNAIQDFLNSNAARKEQGFKVRG